MATADLTYGGARGLLRRSVLLIAVAGLLCAAIFTYWMAATPDPEANPGAFASYMRSIGELGSNIAYLVGVVLLLFGVLALYGVLARWPRAPLALAGLVLQVLSLSAILVATGAAALGGAVVAELYREGQTGVAPALDKLSGGTFGTAILVTFVLAMVLALPGAIVTGMAIWRSGCLPRWTAIVFGLGFVLFVGSTPLITHLGGILLAVASVGMARAIDRPAPAGAMETRPA